MTERRKPPERTGTAANLEWPPTKEDLERLYLRERLSASKISAAYGLRYENPKCGETLILYHLKKRGISRRDAAEHVRKVTEPMVEEWVRRYEAGESLKQIAGEAVDPVTVFNHLRRRGLKIRDKVEEVIRLNTKHPKTPFSGDPLDRAYIMGFARGDFWVTTHGRAIRVRAGSTHPAFIHLFRELFESHGPVYLYPKEAELTGFEWSMDADLDQSFRFLLDRDSGTFQETMSEKTTFLSYFAGFFDAEGSVYYHKKGDGGAFELSIANMDLPLLETLNNKLHSFGYSSKITKNPQNQPHRKIPGADHIWRIQIWRYDEVKRLLTSLPLRHSEKKMKKQIALKLPSWPAVVERRTITDEWNIASAEISREVQESIEEARQRWEGNLSHH
jgi:intein-encoded DNA endonuclease-like protein